MTHRLREQARSHILIAFQVVDRLTQQGFSGRFDGLFFRLKIYKSHIFLGNKQMKK
jgi:hypothetical protein